MIYEKILGGLIGGAAGDAMGAATEARTTEQILECFGHKVTDFETPPQDTFAHGSRAGQVTDDFSQAYFIARQVVENDGLVDTETVQRALIEWSEHHEYFDRFAGPTTRTAIRIFKGEDMKIPGGYSRLVRQATNGASMRIAPIGLLNACKPERAVQDAATVTMVTHDNYLAISGAAALAAACSEACRPDADVLSVVRAGLQGAVQGEKIGLEISRDVAGASVVKRLEYAVSLGLATGTPEEKCIEIRDRIGCGLHISEAVSTAFGIFVANNGDPMATIIAAVNLGYDTDTVATMAGALAGTLAGADAFPPHFLKTLEQANGFEISGLAADLTRLVERRQYE